MNDLIRGICIFGTLAVAFSIIRGIMLFSEPLGAILVVPACGSFIIGWWIGDKMVNLLGFDDKEND